MAFELDDKLVVAISSRALFALDTADAVFRTEGVGAYRAHQRANENSVLAAGTAMPLVKALLRINEAVGRPLVEVIVVSQNDADTGQRVMQSAAALGLPITRAAFTAGEPAAPYVGALAADLFLSADPTAVREAVEAGIAAAQVLAPPDGAAAPEVGPVRIAFDGDAVLFDATSEQIYQAGGLEAFTQHEVANAHVPMNPGPFEPFLRALAKVQAATGDDRSLIRTSLVTARNAPAHTRLVNTLRAWNVRIDETFFLGGIEKARVLNVLKPHIFFDDQRTHLDPARATTPSAHVIGTDELDSRKQ